MSYIDFQEETEDLSDYDEEVYEDDEYEDGYEEEEEYELIYEGLIELDDDKNWDQIEDVDDFEYIED